MTALRSWQCDESGIAPMAQEFCGLLQVGDWVTLDGDLGAGKTTLVKVCGDVLGASTQIVSPTFGLMSRIPLLRPIRNISRILHLDLYRIKKNSDICYLGLEQEFQPHRDIVFVEWADQVDQQGWEDFFQVTGCPQPKRRLHLEIRTQLLSREYHLYQN